MNERLKKHPASGPTPIKEITVEWTRNDDNLAVVFRASGDIEMVKVPVTTAPTRQDNLWKSTCFEIFSAAEERYLEFNIAPSTQWASYAFDAYRKGRRDGPAIDPAALAVNIEPQALTVAVTAPLQQRARAPLRLGFSAVVEDTDGNHSFWALAHMGDQPDFHDPRCFIQQIP